MNALSISLLAVLLLTLAGCGEKATGSKTEAVASAAQTKELTPEEKFAETKKKAEAGYTDAQVNLGWMYYHGKGVPKDAAKVMEWWQKAAAQGYADAQVNLGWMYAKGEGVPEDDAKAAVWYQKAAEQGYDRAQTILGVMYADGEGVSKNIVLAYAWSNLAAAQGNDMARKNRDIYGTQLTAAQRAEGQRLASNWKKGDTLIVDRAVMRLAR